VKPAAGRKRRWLCVSGCGSCARGAAG
jgi:hypothetical protein